MNTLETAKIFGEMFHTASGLGVQPWDAELSINTTSEQKYDEYERNGECVRVACVGDNDLVLEMCFAGTYYRTTFAGAYNAAIVDQFFGVAA